MVLMYWQLQMHPYESLSTNLKNSINEYYKVNSMENYDEMLRAVAFYTFKYGKIDWIESNNEYLVTAKMPVCVWTLISPMA